MSTLTFLITFLLLFFFIHHIGASSAPLCTQHTCSFDSSPWIEFPFRLQKLQPSLCGYSESFDLSCNNQSETILTLPSSGDFIVKDIDYTDQNVRITDLNSCLPRLFLDHGLSLKGSPFSYANDLVNFTLLNCSSVETPYTPISCLSNNDQYVINAVLSGWSVPPSCSVFSTASAPLKDPYDWSNIDVYGVELAWDVPDCRFCVGLEKVCGFENAKSSKLTCLDIYNNDSLNDGTLTPPQIALLTCFGFLVLMFTTACFLIRFMRTCCRVQQPIVESSTITNQQPPAVMKGLDDATIESYPKIQLGQSWDLPKPNDNTCPICLGTYKSRETLRTIPECSHYFHANCIDEWLRRNATCPLCRNPSEGNKVIIEV